MAESAYLGSEDTEILRPKMGKTEIFWAPGLFLKQGIYIRRLDRPEMQNVPIFMCTSLVKNHEMLAKSKKFLFKLIYYAKKE